MGSGLYNFILPPPVKRKLAAGTRDDFELQISNCEVRNDEGLRKRQRAGGGWQLAASIKLGDSRDSMDSKDSRDFPAEDRGRLAGSSQQKTGGLKRLDGLKRLYDSPARGNGEASLLGLRSPLSLQSADSRDSRDSMDSTKAGSGREVKGETGKRRIGDTE